MDIFARAGQIFCSLDLQFPASHVSMELYNGDWWTDRNSFDHEVNV